ncbi:MAG TPA: ABC transporter permease [Sporichthyaceae bacterium]|jgi:ABC-type branched-subunit amino acid transport system permease subunit|nr:ABC transporter permease [Sporichthyaceae bacterium]
MSQYVPYLVFGIVYGSIYGLAAMGLVLTYRTSGIFNFGHGAIGAGAAYVFYELRDENGMPWPFAALLAVGVFGALLGLLLEGMSRRLSRVPVAYQIVGTIGLLLLIRALVTWIYGSEFRLFGAFLPRGRAFTISGVSVAQDSVIIFASVSVAAVGLYVLVERSRLGTMMRAVVDDPALLDTAGVAPARVRRQAWVIGSIFAAASGVLLASQQQELDVTLLSLLVVQAFGAAALGAFRSLPLAYAGGIAVGIAQKLVSKETSTHEWLQGLDFNVPFIVLFFALLLLGRRRLGDLGAQIRARTAPPLPMPPGLRLGGGVAVLVGALLVPHIVGSRLPVWISALSQVLLFLSLGLLVHTSGQVSLCHVALAAVGAAAFAHAESGGVPWGLAVLWGGVVAIPVGAMVAIPAIRLSGLFLGLATLGFGIFIAQFFYTKSYMFGLDDLKTHRPSAFESDTSYYYLLLAFAIVGIALILTIQRSRLGRLLRSLGDSPTALATLGASANITRVLVFCISAFIAGIGGALYAGEFGSVGGTGFNFVGSLVLLAVLAASGRSTITGAILGPVLVYVLPAYHSGADDGFQIAFGAGAILAAVFATTKVHLPLHDWARAGRWRRESTTTARISARTVLVSPFGANR